MGSSLVTARGAAPADWQTRDYTAEIAALDASVLEEAADRGYLPFDEEDAPDFIEGTNEEDGGDAFTSWRDGALRQAVTDALASLRDEAGGRGLNTWDLHGDDGWVRLETGGPTWGDDPTDAYPHLVALVKVGIFQPLRSVRVKPKRRYRVEVGYACEYESKDIDVEAGDDDEAALLAVEAFDNRRIGAGLIGAVFINGNLEDDEV